MFKKFALPLSLALLAALLVFGAVSAAGEQPGRANAQAEKPGRGAGQITAIGDDEFTVRRLNGAEVTVLVDEATQFFFNDGSEASFSDLQVGLWVAGGVERKVGGLTALRVIIFPEGFDPGQVARRAAGEVTATGSDTFTLETHNGETLTIFVDADTVFVGEVQSLAEMEPGMNAAVALKESDGALIAVTLGARFPVIRHAGEILSVEASSFTLETRQGETLTFAVDLNTQFFGRDGSALSLADLEAGMLAGVGARQMEDGSYLALRVGARAKPDLKVGGQITAIGDNSFTLQTRDGQSYTFAVNENTKYLSRGGFVQSFADLQVGMIAGVGALEENGQYTALGVAVARKLSQ